MPQHWYSGSLRWGVCGMPQHQILTLTMTPYYFFRGPDWIGDPLPPQMGP